MSTLPTVIPAKAGIQAHAASRMCRNRATPSGNAVFMDSRLRGNDGEMGVVSRVFRASFLTAILLTAAPALAQQRDPFNGPPRAEDRREERPERRGTEFSYRGDFVLTHEGNQLLMLDSRSGCVWSRTPADLNSSFSRTIWTHEFPRAQEQACQARMAAAIAAARMGGN